MKKNKKIESLRHDMKNKKKVMEKELKKYKRLWNYISWNIGMGKIGK